MLSDDGIYYEILHWENVNGPIMIPFIIYSVIYNSQTLDLCVLQSVTRIGQTGTKSVFSQSGNSREVTPILVAQTQSSGPQTRYLLWCHYLIFFSFSCCTT